MNCSVIPTPVIDDRKYGVVAFTGEAQGDLPRRRGGIDRVLDEVTNHVLQAIFMPDRSHAGREFLLDDRLGIGFRRADAPDQGLEIDRPGGFNRRSRRRAIAASARSSCRRRARPCRACRPGIRDFPGAAAHCWSISVSWATRFFRSWTTNADIRLNASNLRASSNASARAHLAEIARRLAARSFQQIAHFPVEVDRRARRGQHDEAQQLGARDTAGPRSMPTEAPQAIRAARAPS